MFLVYVVFGFFVAPVVVNAIVVGLLNHFVSLHLTESTDDRSVMKSLDKVDSVTRWWIRQILVTFRMEYYRRRCARCSDTQMITYFDDAGQCVSNYDENRLRGNTFILPCATLHR